MTFVNTNKTFGWTDVDIIRAMLKDGSLTRTVIFVPTIDECTDLYEQLIDVSLLIQSTVGQ